MSRMRTIKPSFFTNEELARLSPFARLLFAGLWTLADRDGRLEDRPRRIKAELLPYDDDVDVDALLADLAAAGFIRRYEVAAAGRFIWIVTFLKHQKPHSREIASVIPAPAHDLGDAEARPRETQAIMPFDLGAPAARPLGSPGEQAGEVLSYGILDPCMGSEIGDPDPGAGADPEPPPARAVDTAALSELAQTWARALGHSCTGMHQDMLREELGRGTPPAWIDEAIRDAAAQGITRWRYIASIIERYYRERPPGGTADDETRFRIYQQAISVRAYEKRGLPWEEAVAAAQAEIGPYAGWLERYLAELDDADDEEAHAS